MPSFNRVILLGNITRDPQTKFLPSQTAVAEFGIAMNRKFRTASGEDREEVCFVDCAAFGKTGELIGKHFTKGKPIFIEGRLKFDSWEDKQGGGKRSKLSIIVENFQFVGGRDGGGEQGEPGDRQLHDDDVPGTTDVQRTQRPARGVSQRPQRQQAALGDDPSFDNSDIPFVREEWERQAI